MMELLAGFYVLNKYLWLSLVANIPHWLRP